MSLPRTPWTWLPTLYIAEGIPYIVVTVVATIMYKRLGIGNADIAFYTSWLYLPWVIKPFWSPIVDAFATKRTWIIAMQLIVGAALGGLALTLPAPGFFKWSLAFFWLLAFSSATHDIAADGFYMLALTKKEQAFYVGIRSTFYRVAIIAGQGLLIMLAGTLELIYKPAAAWATVMLVAAALFLLLAAWHLASLPRTEIRAECPRSQGNFIGGIIKPFISFFRKPGIGSALAFMLLYRLPEAFLTKITPLFLLDSVEGGGLALTTAEIGFVQGTVGIVGLTLGGILGGITNGMPVEFTVTFKPTPTIAVEQETVDLETMKNVTLSAAGRHDSCIVLRAAPIVEAAAALALCQLMEVEPAEDITEYRNKIDEIDEEIVRLLSERLQIGGKIGTLKALKGQKIRDKQREAEVLRSRGDLAPEYRDAIEAIFATIMAQTREVEK